MIFNLKKIKNSQGDLFKILSKKDKNFKRFGECYISEIKPKKIKAWRYHKKNKQKIIVINGECRIILFIKNKFKNYNLSYKNKKLLIIPKKTWYGIHNFTRKKTQILNILENIYDEREVIRKKEKEILYTWQ